MRPAASMRQLLLLNISAMVSIELLQNAMVSFASGYISGGIGAAPEEFSFAAAAYAGAAILMISRHRWLVGHLGYRNFVRLSLALFVIGAVLCATAGNADEFIAGRFVQALGGSAFFTTARIQVNRFEGAERGLAIRYLGTGLVTSSACAAWVVSRVLEYGSWRAIFLAPLPLVAVVAVLSEMTLQPRAQEYCGTRQLHAAQTILLAAAVLAAQYFFERAPYDFFSNPLELIAVCAIALAGLLAFVIREMKHPNPLLPFASFLHGRYLTGMVVYAMCYLVISSNNYVLPIFLQRGLGYASLPTGALLSGASMCSLLVMGGHFFAAAKSAPQKKYLVVAFIGLAAFGFSLSAISPDVARWQLFLPLLGLAVFTPLGQAIAAMNTFRDTSDDVFSQAYQTKNMLRELLNSTGISVATIVLQARSMVHYTRLAEHINIAELQLKDAGPFAVLVNAAPDSPLWSQLAAIVARQATMSACLDFFFAVGCLGIVGIGMTIVQRRIA